MVFDWLMAALSYQGIADQVAFEYMERYGQATWQVIASDPSSKAKLSEAQKLLAVLRLPLQQDPVHLRRARSPAGLPTAQPLALRNGRLNQTAYALHLFIRDVAGGDLVGWIDRRLDMAANSPAGPHLPVGLNRRRP